MPDPARLRDSTQILVPHAVLEDLETPLTEEFAVSIVTAEPAHARIIGSPVEIKAASDYLARCGVSVR